MDLIILILKLTQLFKNQLKIYETNLFTMKTTKKTM
jgi:hypothetical protein